MTVVLLRGRSQSEKGDSETHKGLVPRATGEARTKLHWGPRDDAGAVLHKDPCPFGRS
jgi:hypothetical protein